MKKLLFLLCFILCGCSTINETISIKNKTEQLDIQTSFVRKDFKPIGRVRAEYERYCFLFGLFCTDPYFIQDDLIQQAKSMGANEVVDIVVDSAKSPLIWSWLFAHEEVKANGLAVLLTPEDLSRGKK
ncbi:MAG: hypothetical protein J6P93_05365 [Alphaproteobacteria bacterium]|nr:hypothetical protein [Alphaproteobacteria bacterium]